MANNIGNQVLGVLAHPNVLASAIAGGSIGTLSGALLNGQRAEEMGLPLSQQVTATLGGGLRTGLKGAAIGYGGSAALTVAKSLLGKK